MNELATQSLQINKKKAFSKEASIGSNNNNNASFRIYYGDVSGSVPFTWESQPGTPKHHSFFDTRLPPLTPPPSYLSNSSKIPIKRSHSRSTFLNSLFLSLNNPIKQGHVSPSSPSSLSSSWSSSSTSIGLSKFVKKRRSRVSSRSSFDSMMDCYYSEYEEPKLQTTQTSSAAATTNTCFGFGSGTGARGGGFRRSCTYSASSMKKALMSIVGQGSKLRY